MTQQSEMSEWSDLDVSTRLTKKPGLRPATATLWVQAVERAVERMRNELDQPLRLEAMAEVALLSLWHFARVFHHVTGMPPAQFLATLRLAEAKRLLLSTSLSIADICYQVGYNSPGSFTTRFTQSIGVSPGRFRQLGGRHTVADAVPDTTPESPRPQEPQACELRGRLISEEHDRQVFLGLFTSPVPEGLPTCCRHLPHPSPFHFDNVPPGTYHLLAVSVPPQAPNILEASPEGRLHVGGVGPIVLGSIRSRDVEVRLRRATPADPPILLAIDLLMAPRQTGQKRSA